MRKYIHYNIAYKNKWKKQSFINREHTKNSGCFVIVQYQAAIKKNKAGVYVLI